MEEKKQFDNSNHEQSSDTTKMELIDTKNEIVPQKPAVRKPIVKAEVTPATIPVETDAPVEVVTNETPDNDETGNLVNQTDEDTKKLDKKT